MIIYRCEVCQKPLNQDRFRRWGSGQGRKPETCSDACRKRKSRLFKKWGDDWRNHIPRYLIKKDAPEGHEKTAIAVKS